MSDSMDHCADVVIVGSGLVAAILARFLLREGLRVLIVESGAQMSQIPGTHLRNAFECQANRGFYNDLVRSHLRPASVPSARRPLFDSVPLQAPGHNGTNPEQQSHLNLPAARTTNLVGGMGALWSCVASRFNEELEQWRGIGTTEWNYLYRAAEEVLNVGTQVTENSKRQHVLLDVLSQRYNGVDFPFAQNAPIAGRCRGDRQGLITWTGPAEILGDEIDKLRTGKLQILSQHVVRRFHQAGGRIVSAEVLALEPWAGKNIAAEVFIAAAGAIRTPALLWNSGICRDAGSNSPLGRYLCDHPVAYAQLALSPDIMRAVRARGEVAPLPAMEEDPDPFICIPISAARPIHSLLLCDTYDTRILEGRINDRWLLSLYWYCMVEPQFENRIVFNDRMTDAFGLPHPTFEYALAEADKVRLQLALADLKAAGGLLGSFLPTAPPQVLPRGSSLHVMGTTRMGICDDGTSVVDTYGRVWGLSNLYLGGTGLIPSPSATNPTLTACALGVRTAQAILRSFDHVNSKSTEASRNAE